MEARTTPLRFRRVDTSVIFGGRLTSETEVRQDGCHVVRRNDERVVFSRREPVKDDTGYVIRLEGPKNVRALSWMPKETTSVD